MDNPLTSTNPFRACRIQPGAVAYLFPPGWDAAALIDRLQRFGWRGQIVGPHGSGKSTLLSALTPALDRAGRPAVQVTLHDRQRRLPGDFWSDPRLRPPAVVVVDGYEQLGRWSRWRLRRFCRRRGLGLIATAHEPVGLPDLWRTTVTFEVAERVVAQLLGDLPVPWTAEVLAVCLARHGGDLRETLFELYDLYEQRR